MKIVVGTLQFIMIFSLVLGVTIAFWPVNPAGVSNAYETLPSNHWIPHLFSAGILTLIFWFYRVVAALHWAEIDAWNVINDVKDLPGKSGTYIVTYLFDAVVNALPSVNVVPMIFDARQKLWYLEGDTDAQPFPLKVLAWKEFSDPYVPEGFVGEEK